MATNPTVMALAEVAAEQATQRAQRHRTSNVNADERWYVAHNSAGNDHRAKETLERADFEVYYPSEASMKVVARNKLSQKQRLSPIALYRPVFKPLFPRYFFVHFDLARGDWHDVFALAGLHGIIFTDDTSHSLPAPIDDDVIAKMKGEEVDCSIPGAILAKNFAYKIGERVKISAGPLAGFSATVEAIPNVPIEALDESARLKLLVALFGRASVVEMPLADIEKL